MTRTRRKLGPMTSLQEQTLASLVETGVANPGEIGRRLLVAATSARSALEALERRRYADATYTGHRFPGRAYAATDAGRSAYRETFGDD